MELSGSRLKIFPIFSYISGNGNPPPKIPNITGNSTNRKIPSKKFLYFIIFWETKLFGFDITKFLIFSQKKTFFIFREK